MITLNILFVVLAMTASAVSLAQDPISVSYTSDFKSSYVGGQTAMRIYEGPVTQHSLTISRTGTYAYVWVSAPLDSRWNTNFGSEIDLGLGHDFELSKLWRVDIGYSYYNLVPLETTRGDLHALGLTLYATAGDVRPFLKFEYDFAQNHSVLPGGPSYKLGATWLHPTGIEVQGALFGHGQTYGIDPEVLSAVQLGLSKSFTVGSAPVKAGVLFQSPLGRGVTNGGFSHRETVFWLSIRY